MLKNLIELHRQNRLDEAEQGYRGYLAEHPQDAEAYHLLGQLCRQRGAFDEAEQLIRHAHELAPEQAMPLLTLGVLRARHGDRDAARGYYEHALSLDPNLGAAHSLLGQLLLSEGHNEAAAQHFHMALRIGEDAQALSGLGALALAKNDYALAVRYLTRAVEAGPNDASIHFLLAQTFLTQGTDAFAEQSLNNALRLQPDFPLARRVLAQILLQAGRLDDAEPHYRMLAATPTATALGIIGLADVARARARFDEAADGYAAALAMGSQPPGVTKALAESLSRLGKVDEALAAYDRYLLLQPGDSDAQRARADLLTGANRVPAAIAAWKAFSADHPDDRQAHLRLLILYEYAGDFEEALQHAEWVAARETDEPESTLVRIRAHLRAGDTPAARALLDRSGTLSWPQGASRLRSNYLGRIHDQAAEYGNAVHCFAEAQRGTPSNLPPLAEPAPELEQVLAETPGPRWADAPVLLLGLPGSGVEQIAALLADQPELVVLRDRIGTRLRDDDFNAPHFARYLGDIDDKDLNEIRTRYLAPLHESGVDTSRTRIEWLPRWDAHMLALVRRVMPGTRIIIVERDPRAALLNWLAFGWVPSIGCPDVVQAAAWMTRAQRHLDVGADLDEPHRLHVDADAVLADPANAGAALAKFLNIEYLQAGANSQRMRTGLGGLSIAFSGVHWQNYRAALAEPFATLENKA